MLYAVGLTETGRKGSLQPYAINIEGKTVSHTSERAAMKSFKMARLDREKTHDPDACRSITTITATSLSVEEMLDPQKNVGMRQNS